MAPMRRPSSASVDGDLVMTDGPFVEAKEHIAGFYIINADDLDAALAWARQGRGGDQPSDRGPPLPSDRARPGDDRVASPPMWKRSLLSACSVRRTARRWQRWSASSAISRSPKTQSRTRSSWQAIGGEATASHPTRRGGSLRPHGTVRSMIFAVRPVAGSSTNSSVLVATTSHDPDSEECGEDGPVRDDRLRLIFTCCHPALRTEHHVALTLRLLGGLSVEEVARSFLVSESAMAKRLVRAKYKIKAAKIPYRVPDEADLPERLRSVLSVLYLIYNTGLDGPERASLRSEAIRLARALVELMPDEPEAAGLLALDAAQRVAGAGPHRRGRPGAPARSGPDQVGPHDDRRGACDRARLHPPRPTGSLPTPGRDPSRALRTPTRSKQPTGRRSSRCTISLFSVMPTPVVALNRAIAIAEIEGPGAALTDARRDRAGPRHLSPDARSPRHDVASAWTTRGRGGRVRTRRPPRSDGSGPPVPRATDRGAGRGRSLVTRSWIHAVESSLVMIRVDSGRRAR